MINTSWNIPELDLNNIVTGDMPGDKIRIEDKHISKANRLFPEMSRELLPMLEDNKVVLSVYGGSGVGKSEIASILAYYLNFNKIETYILSGDNYALRRPELNDLERDKILNEKGIEGLRKYLGSPQEIDFNRVNQIISEFKSGTENIPLKRLGRLEHEEWEDLVNFTKCKILIIEWTHGNSFNLEGIDYPIFLHSSPEETLEHRKKRNRDSNTESSLISTVLKLEQELLDCQSFQAKLILTKDILIENL